MEDWIIALLCAGISALVSVLVSVFSKSQERQKFYSQMISGDRLSWVEKMREISAEFLALAEMDQRTAEENKRMLVLKNAMLVRLSPKGVGLERDDIAREILESDNIGREQIAALREILPQIFSDQWQRAKVEAGKDVWDAAYKKTSRMNRNK